MPVYCRSMAAGGKRVGGLNKEVFEAAPVVAVVELAVLRVEAPVLLSFLSVARKTSTVALPHSRGRRRKRFRLGGP